MEPTKGRRVQMSIYLEPEIADRFKALSDATRIPMAVYMREGIDHVLERYKRQIPKAAKAAKK